MDQLIRRLWGQVYTGLGSGKSAAFIEYAEDSLRNGLVRLRREHGPEHADIAAMMHDLAAVMLVRQRAGEAEQTCREALAMRRKLLGDSSTAAAESRALLARILRARGRPDEAERQADAVLRELRESPAPEADLLIAAMAGLKGRVCLDHGEPGVAEPWVIDSITRRLRHLPPEDPELLASLADGAELARVLPGGVLAAHFAAAWQLPPGEVGDAVRRDAALLAEPDRGDQSRVVPSGRSSALARLLHLAERLLRTDDPALVGILTALIRATESEGLLELRVDAALRAAQILERRFGENDFSVLLYVEQAASVLALTARPDRAVELGERACRIWDAVPRRARDMLLAANSRRRLGWYLAMVDRASEAVPVLRQSMEEIAEAVGREHRSYALAESTLAYCLAESGSTDEAEQASAHALALAERLPATPPDQLAHNLFVRGHILRLSGRFAEARPALEGAWNQYFKFAGPAYRWWTICMEDLVTSCEKLDDRPGAAKWRAEVEQRASELSALGAGGGKQ